MRYDQIPDCCITAIYERGVDVLHLQKRLPYVAYLCCDNCGESYRLTIPSGEPLRSKVHRPRYNIIIEHLVEVKGKDEMESRFKTFVVSSEAQYYAALEVVADSEEPKQINELKK